jgi:hypothetical protein
MKKIFFALAILATSIASAQVGVGNTSPKATLDITGVSTTTVADGVLVPRYTAAVLATKDNAYGADQNGALVFITDASSATGKTADVTAVGFYYYNHATSKWKAVGGASAAPAVSVRVPSNGTLTAADLNGYIIDGAGYTYNLATLTTASEGDTITFMQNSGNVLTINGTSAGSSTTPSAQGGGITFVYDADTNAWYSINSF